MTEDDVRKLFAYQHLPEHLQRVSRPFSDLAFAILDNVPAGPSRTKALNDLWQSKNWAVMGVVLND